MSAARAYFSIFIIATSFGSRALVAIITSINYELGGSRMSRTKPAVPSIQPDMFMKEKNGAFNFLFINSDSTNMIKKRFWSHTEIDIEL